MADIEFRYHMPKSIEGSDMLLRFDGRVLELHNLYSGASTRVPIPEIRIEQAGPDRKGRASYKFISQTENVVIELELEEADVPGMDDFVAKVQKAAGG
jgi:hypothetical protein